MNYAAESRPQVREWFNGWIEFEKKHQHGRQIAVGIGAYQNTQDEVLAQISRVRQPSHGGIRAAGMSLYSYGGMFRVAQPPSAVSGAPRVAQPPSAVQGAPPAPRPEVPPLERTSFLSTSGAPFASEASIPPLKWIDSPTRGGISGTLKRSDGTPIDGGAVRVRRSSWFASTQRVTADGNGNFGLANLKPGTYRVQSGDKGKPSKVTVTPGGVARADLAF
jgi:hypothetical protein